MKNPQSFAIDVAHNIKAIADNGCLAMCYLYCAGVEPDTEVYIRCISKAMDAGLLDSDCFVLDAEKFLSFVTDRKYTITKKNSASIDQIANPAPVRYTYNGKNHWVVAERGKIVFNSLINSLCVTKGKLAQDADNLNTRIVKIAK